ncbi:threonylcarbamoyl-AMP synthase [Candidatus Thorarchaeota archaeon]|nr:MAG: threonylcarbamoyl-AMP synthase [Candidatus Thorarchaeota archaeon]
MVVKSPLNSRTLTIDDNNMSQVVDEAAEELLAGGLVVYPTDTSYGLACDPRQEGAIERLIDAKERRRDLGVPLLFADMKQCEPYHEFLDLERVLTRLFWPGPLTLVVSPQQDVSNLISGGRGSILIRVPGHQIPREIARKIEAPIVGTSANKSGGPSPYTVSEAEEQLGNEVDLYIDAGPSSSEKDSTIIGVQEEDDSSIIKIYREGELSVAQLNNVLKGDTEALRFWTNRIVYANM